MSIGHVAWFDRHRGFGFIQPDVGPCRVYVHMSSVRSSGLSGLVEGQRLEFELTQMRDGRPAAFGLRVLE